MAGDEFVSQRGLFVTSGGGGEKLIVMLHGLGANSAVWRRMIALAPQRWAGRWVAPDFRGHGRSAMQGPWGYAAHAADIAALIEDEKTENVTLLGHSFGGPVAALVAAGWFGPRMREVVAVGVKIDWTEDEVAKARELALRPARSFSTRAEAIERYLKVSGLFGLVDPASPEALAGVTGNEGDYRVALDPRAYGAVGPSIEKLLRLASALRLAAGANDPMVSLGQMRRIDPAAIVFDDVGHNAHWEAPESVWNFVNPPPPVAGAA
jgi:pimeloyl-ACP methyl ester carboxylesterase